MRALPTFCCSWVRKHSPSLSPHRLELPRGIITTAISRNGILKTYTLTRHTPLTGLVCLIFLICSLRTNIAFFLIFLSLVGAFSCLSAAYFYLALVYENPTNTTADKKAERLVVAGGAFAFVTSMAGWWIFLAIMLASLDFPFSVPVGDLSHIIKGASEKKKIKDSV